jgi:hypothetical protein
LGIISEQLAVEGSGQPLGLLASFAFVEHILEGSACLVSADVDDGVLAGEFLMAAAQTHRYLNDNEGLPPVIAVKRQLLDADFQSLAVIIFSLRLM